MLAESLSLGFKALAWSANRQSPKRNASPRAPLGGTIAVALTIFTGLFILLPVRRPGREPVGAARGLRLGMPPEDLRLALFIGYLLLIGRLRDVARLPVPRAEHKVIAAYENGVELTPESGAALHDRACSVRHELPADCRHSSSSHVRGPSRLAAPHPRRGPVDPADRQARLRGHPPRPAHGLAHVRVLMRPGSGVAAADDARAHAGSARGGDRASLRAVMTAERLAEGKRRFRPDTPCPGPPSA